MTDTPIPERLAAAFEGRYRLVRELGEGGMAKVYLAEDLKHDRQVAIKVLKPELAAVIGGERFVAEIKTTAGLQHPHILPLFDSGEADGFLFYVMPYVEGETLRQRLDRERQLGVEDALQITRDVADALDYAHRQGVIHRDIKPENILLHDGRPVVADFGIAVAISAAGGGRMTETGLSLGTPHYMSPEQATADRDLTVRSDVYSLACVLYEMLAGDPPHTGPSAQAILVRILTETPRPVTDTRTSVPPHIAAVLAKGLEKLPADRFDSAAEFRSALDRTDFTYIAVAREPAATGRTASSSVKDHAPATRRSRPLVPILAATTVILTIVAAVGWFRSADSPAAAGAYMLDTRGWDVAGSKVEVSPDGRVFAAIGTPADSTDGDRLLIRRAGELDFRAILAEGRPRYPRFSPDGERIVYADWDAGSIRVIPVEGGSPSTRLQRDGFQAYDFTWADDGYIYFWAESQVRRIPEVGGPADTLLANADWVYDPRPLPGGRALLMTDVRTSPVSLALYDIEADSVRTIVSEAINGYYVESGHLIYGHPEGGLQAIPFDLGRLEVTGAPTPVRDGVSVDGPRAWFSLAADGTLVYVEGRAASVNARATLVERDLRTGEDTGGGLAPRPIQGVAYAPDGDRIAMGAAEPGGERDDTELHTYNLRSATPPRPWPFEERSGGPAWSPAGDRVVYDAYDGATGWLMLQDVTSEAPPRRLPTEDDATYRYGATWANDSVIVYVRDAAGAQALWTVGASGSPGPEEYFAVDGRLDSPDVSPDGTRVAYSIFGEYDAQEVAVRSFPDPGVPIRVSVGGGGNPRWHSDGSSLFYQSRQSTLMQAFVSTDGVFTVDSTRTVFDMPRGVSWWDIHPDGDRILLARPVDDADSDDDEASRERHVVVLNWFDEMSERLGN